ncbi:MAG: hypothetical protein EOO27_21130 [Comamonadaceae bacterium]|nr:MAG: hypothetical protein EOO27_21130 [Comamonadaceae bacterium]
MKALRNIAVVVVEPEPGRFFWQLREAEQPTPNGWELVKQSRYSRAAWLEAFNEGVEEVLSITRNVAAGPRG